MKIRITYKTVDELIKALATPLCEFITNGAKVKANKKNDFKHVYITIDKDTEERIKLDNT